MKTLTLHLAAVSIALILSVPAFGQESPSGTRLSNLFKQFPEADTNGDGTLSLTEAMAYRKKFPAKVKAKLEAAKRGKAKQQGQRKGVKRDFKVDSGWDLERFPEQAVCYKTPAEMKAVFESVIAGLAASKKLPSIVSFPKPVDGAIRVVGIGHSFMKPGYQTLPLISQAAGMKQPLLTHVGGGMTGSARYKWEQENGIFEFDGKPFPKLLTSIAHGKWEAMMFGPYFNDRPVYFSCWIDFCLKYNPDMKFYISDAWPQLEQLSKRPESEAYFTAEVLDQMGRNKRAAYSETLDPLRQSHPNKVFVLPTSDAMVLAAKHFIRGELPGVDGLHRTIGGKERSLWKDQLGHLGPGLERLEGYVFYATLYGKSPELIETAIEFGGNDKFPSPELDRMFRKIAWQAVVEHPYSGVTDKNSDGINDAQTAIESKASQD